MRHRAPTIRQQVEESQKQTRLEALGENFQCFTAPGVQPAHLPCMLCDRPTLGRVRFTPACYIALCPDHDAWTVASLVYVDETSRDELPDAYEARR